ncbi:Isoprenoid synthase domain containing protein [Naviculisporaceae sp. PSN 640]
MCQLKGQTLRLPNLSEFYSQWPNRISPHYEDLRQIIDDKINEWIPDERVRIKAHKIDLPFFCAVWYPGSALDRLEFLAWYSLWLFLWDDDVEDLAIPISRDISTSVELQKVQWLHKHALEYIRFHLGLCDESTPEPQTPTKYCTLFKHAGAPMRKGASLAERGRFFEAIKEYMDCVEVECDYVLGKRLPSLQEYWETRLGTSSVNTYSAFGEFMGNCQIPPHLFDTQDMHSLWFEINRHIVAMNDLASLKKEMSGQALHSLVPVIINETGCDLDTAAGSVIETLRISGENLDKTADGLLALAEKDGSDARASVEAYLYSFWTSMTGSYWWSLSCPRYGVGKYLQQDGSLVIPL